MKKVLLFLMTLCIAFPALAQEVLSEQKRVDVVVEDGVMPLTSVGGYDMYLYANGVSASTTVFARYQEFTTSCDVANMSGNTIDATYFRYGLTDKDGNLREFISSIVLMNSFGNGYYVELELPCTITTEDLAVGDRIYMYAQANATDDNGWVKITDYYGDAVSTYVEVGEVGDPVYSWNVMLVYDGLTSNVSEYYTGIDFTTTIQTVNWSTIAIDTCYFRIGLTDENGNILEWISDIRSCSNYALNVVITQTIACSISSELQAGYRIRVFYQPNDTSEDGWLRAEPNDGANDEIVITEDMIVDAPYPYIVQFYGDGLSTETEVFYTGIEFTISMNVVNWSDYIEKCYFKAVLTDSEGNEKEQLFIYSDDLETNGAIIATMKCSITGDVAVNDRIRVYFQANATDEDDWHLVEPYKDDVPWEIVISEVQALAQVGDKIYDPTSGLYYNILSETEVEVTYFNRRANMSYVSSNVVIPEEVTYQGKTYTVTAIGQEAFIDCGYMTSVTIPASVTTIGEDAFYNCSSLTSVTIPASVTTIAEDTFLACTSLQTFVVEEGNQYYSTDDSGVLFNKDKTTLICYPLGSNSTTYTIPESVTTIGDDAFDGNSVLTSVVIGENVKTIGKASFGYTILTSVIIPNSVTTIGYNAFRGSKALTSVTLGSSVETMDSYTFYGCTSLTSVTSLNPVPPALSGSSNFYNCSATISVPAGTIDEYKNVWGTSRAGVKGYEELDYAVLKIGTTSYATYYNEDYDIDISDTGITAYWAEGIKDEDGKSVVILTNPGTTIPAKTAVVLSGAQTVFTEASATASSAESEYTTNMLHGQSTTGTFDAEEGYLYYILTTGGDDGEVGFYYGASDGGAFESAANKAWLAIPGDERRNGLSIKFKDEDDTTGLSSVAADYSEGDGNIYTIQGLRVSTMSQPGIYIVKGKKVLVK